MQISEDHGRASFPPAGLGGSASGSREVKICHMSTERTAPPPSARPATVLVGSYGTDLDAPAHSMLGLGGLFAEMAEQGVNAQALLQDTGVQPAQLDDPDSHLSHRQKIQILRNVQRISRIPDVGLRAGARQRLSDFGVYGYALVSSATFGDAVRLGIKHVRLAGPVLEKRWRVEGDLAIFEGHDVMALGEVLPLATEFWFRTRSSSSPHASSKRRCPRGNCCCPTLVRRMRQPTNRLSVAR